MASSPEPDIITQILSEAGVPTEVLNQKGDASLEDQILSELEAVSKELPPGDTGGTRVIIRGRHINLGEAGWKLVTSLAALGISTLDPTGLTKVVALKEGLDFFKEVRPLLKKLDQGKLLVCSAIASVTAQKKRQMLVEPGASEQDIVNYFAQLKQSAPVKITEILKSLESDKVVKATYYQDSGPFYTIIF